MFNRSLGFYEFQYPQRIVGDFNYTIILWTRRGQLSFSILNGSWVTSTSSVPPSLPPPSRFSILNGSWVTSTYEGSLHERVKRMFQYPQRIVGDFNALGFHKYGVWEKFQYPQRIVGDFNLSRKLLMLRLNNVSVSSTDRG